MAEKEQPVVKRRIMDYYKAKGMSAGDFAKHCGIDGTTFYREGQELRIASLVSILKACPDLDAYELLLGAKPKFENTTIDLPLVPFDAVAGHLKESFEDSYPETIAVPKSVTRGADFVIRVDGDSMTPRFQSGELLLVKKVDDPSFFQWGKIYVLATSQGCVVKRLYPDRDDDNSVVCHSDNTASYPDYTVRKNSIYGVGLVVGHIGHD